jgi:aldehyde:ferredoxin oxidoreductase
MQSHGWVGRHLKIDLSNGTISRAPLDQELAASFIGGRGIGSKLLWDETGPETDPFGPANSLIVSTGPVTGTLIPTSSRFTVTAKSPSSVLGMCSAGCTPVKNYMKSGGTDLEQRKAIMDIETSGDYRFKNISCFGCPLNCNKLTYIDKLGRSKAPVL